MHASARLAGIDLLIQISNSQSSKTVIASGSEAILAGKEELDCFVAVLLAMTLKIRGTTPRSRNANAPKFFQSSAQEKEGAGNAGCPMHPWFRAKKHEVVTTGLPDSTRHSPHNGFTASFVLSPVTGFIATVIAEKLASQELDASIGASGPHDFAVRVSAVRLRAPSRPSHPAPNVRDDRDTPLLRARDGTI